MSPLGLALLIALRGLRSSSPELDDELDEDDQCAVVLQAPVPLVWLGIFLAPSMDEEDAEEI